MNKFAERLKETMLHNNISQVKLANLLGVKQPTVNRYVKGVQEPNFNMLLNICLVLNVNPDFLLGYDDLR